MLKGGESGSDCAVRELYFLLPLLPTCLRAMDHDALHRYMRTGDIAFFVDRSVCLLAWYQLVAD